MNKAFWHQIVDNKYGNLAGECELMVSLDPRGESLETH
jgi:hypothetical protein